MNGVAIVPYAPLDRIIAGITKLAQCRGISRMQNFEASINSSDTQFRVVVFNGAGGGIQCAIEAGGATIYFPTLVTLTLLAGHLAKAKTEIDRIKIDNF